MVKKSAFPQVSHRSQKAPSELLYKWRVGDKKPWAEHISMYVKDEGSHRIMDIMLTKKSKAMRNVGEDMVGQGWIFTVKAGAMYVTGSTARNYNREYLNGERIPSKYEEYVQDGKKILGLK